MLLGTWRSPHLTAAVLDQFLGDQPLDPAAKARAGAGLLYLTNGFRCDRTMASRPFLLESVALTACVKHALFLLHVHSCFRGPIPCASC